MISLFIDTSSTTAIVSIYKDIECISLQKEDNLRDVSSRVMQMLDNALKEANIDIKKINKIFVVNGPGSFTGLRIGVTIAKTIAWSLNIPVVPISSLEVLATTDCESDYIIPYIDARREFVFAGIYNKDLETLVPNQYLQINTLLSYLNDSKTYTFVGESDLGFENKFIPNLNIGKIIAKHFDEEGINPHSLNPNYLKKTEAEEKLNKND